MYPPALWVRAPSLGDGWMKVPLYPHPLRGQKIWNVLGWFLAIGLLSTASAWIFVSQLNQPLKRLVYAARQLGQGRSVRLPISDTPSEMTEVYSAFNQMAEDVEQAGRERELMLAGVSHDLRTPLTRLRLSLELMGNHTDLTDDMVRDIEDMDAILDQFLAFIRDGRDEWSKKWTCATWSARSWRPITRTASRYACAWSRSSRLRCAGSR
jgi:two-component system, OmpR family, osmolarity sensor histidine kinase EnvZ